MTCFLVKLLMMLEKILSFLKNICGIFIFWLLLIAIIMGLKKYTSNKADYEGFSVTSSTMECRISRLFFITQIFRDKLRIQYIPILILYFNSYTKENKIGYIIEIPIFRLID